MVALKVCALNSLQDKDLQRFQRECQALTKLNHPNIVRVYAWGVTADGAPYMALEYVEGLTVQQTLQRRGVLEPQECEAIATQLCDALSYAHSMEIIHRDLKPSNVMLCKDEEGNLQAKILDFGLAKFIGTDLRITKTDMIVGTPTYMAPEQFMSQNLSPRTDLYALACTLYEVLSGKPAFNGQTAFEIFNAHSASEYERLPDTVPERMRNAINIALRPDPETRYASVQEFRNAFTGTEQVVVPHVVHRRPPLMRSLNKHRIAIGACALVLLVAAGAAFFITGDPMKEAAALEATDPKRALAIYNAQFEKMKEEYEDRSPEFLPILAKLAVLENQVGSNAVARKHLKRLSELNDFITKRQYAITNPNLVPTYAEQFRLATLVCGPNSLEAAGSEESLADAYYAADKMTDAREHAMHAKTVYDGLGNHEDYYRLARLYSLLADFAAQDNDLDKSAALMEKNVDSWRKFRDKTNPDIAEEAFHTHVLPMHLDQFRLAKIYAQLGKWDDVLTHIEPVMRDIKYKPGHNFPAEMIPEAKQLYAACRKHVNAE
jgi:serine/threonine protein kinase